MISRPCLVYKKARSISRCDNSVLRHKISYLGLVTIELSDEMGEGDNECEKMG